MSETQNKTLYSLSLEIDRYTTLTLTDQIQRPVQSYKKKVEKEIVSGQLGDLTVVIDATMRENFCITLDQAQSDGKKI